MSEPSDLLHRLRAWSYRRQRLGRAAAGPAAALREVVGVYSTHPTAPLSLLGRSAALAPEQLGELEQRREVVRIPAMRRSIFLVPAETAPRLFAATRVPVEKYAGNLRYAGLDWDGYARLKQRVLDVAREPLTASALQQALAIDQRLMSGVRLLAYEGLILRLGSSLRTDRLRYVATDAWLGQPLAETDPATSLAWLADAYLRAFGPARVVDFAWWSGVPRGRAKAALADAEVVDIGDGLLLPADQQAAFAAVEPVAAGAVDVLPKWDAYTMGHAPDGRRRLVADEDLTQAYSQGGGGTLPGDGLPLVLRGGRAVASWSHRFAGDQLAVRVTQFAPGTLPPKVAERAFDEVGRLLGATAVAVA